MVKCVGPTRCLMRPCHLLYYQGLYTELIAPHLFRASRGRPEAARRRAARTGGRRGGRDGDGPARRTAAAAAALHDGVDHRLQRQHRHAGARQRRESAAARSTTVFVDVDQTQLIVVVVGVDRRASRHGRSTARERSPSGAVSAITKRIRRGYGDCTERVWSSFFDSRITRI